MIQNRAFRRLVFLALAVVTPMTAAKAAGPWVVARSDAGSWYFKTVTWGHGRFVAATAGGILATSLDGGAWRPVTADQEWSITDIASGPDGFVAVGYATRPDRTTNSVILHSPDGAHWTSALPPDTRDEGVTSIAWGDGEWLALGGKVAWMSADGVTWVRHDLVSDVQAFPGLGITGVVRVGDHWLAVGDVVQMGYFHNLSSGWVGTSADGVSWTTVGGGDEPLNGIADNGNRLVAVGDGTIGWSDDGATWSFQDLGESVALDGVAWTGKRFVAVGRDQEPGTDPVVRILVSEDGKTWTQASPADGGVGGDLEAVAASPSGLVAAGAGTVEVSGDGLTWQSLLETPPASTIGPMVAAAPGLVAVGDRPIPPSWKGLHARTVWTSSDGIDWSVGDLPGNAGSVIDLANSGEEVLGIGNCISRSVVIRGEDGRWVLSAVSGPDGSQLRGVAYGPIGYVATLSHGLIATSADGKAWTDRLMLFNTSWNDVVWTGSKYIAVATDLRMAESTDGILWHVTTADEHRAGIERLAAGNGVVVGIGVPGALQVTTDDGESWSRPAPPPYVHLWDIRWTGDEFIAVGGRGTVLESADGLQWTTARAPLGVDLLGVGTISGKTVVTGGGGTIQVRLEAAPALSGTSPDRAVVPAAAHAQGLVGSYWTTDLSLTNPNDQAVLAQLWFLPRKGQPASVPVIVPGAGSLVLDDVVATVFDRAGEAGSLIVDPEAPLLVTSRTASGLAAGSAGQVLPGLPAGQAGAGPVVLPGLAGAPGFRTNIGLVNLSGQVLHCDITIHGGNGSVLATRTAVLDPWGSEQLNRVLDGLDAGNGAWATITGDGPFSAFASVVDFGTNDGATVLPAAITSDPLLIPAAAHTAGYGGAVWRTDLHIVNPGATAARVELRLLPEAGGAIFGGSVDIAPGSAVTVPDVLGTGFPGHQAGALRIVPVSGAVAAWSRTYDVTSSGTLGQGIGALPESELAEGSGRLVVGGLRGGVSEQGWFHTNLGLVNLSDDPATVSVKLFRSSGTLLSSRNDVEVPGRGWLQLLRVLREGTSAPVADGYAVIDAGAAAGEVAAWASVIDDLSGDPSFQLAQQVPAGAN